MGKGRRQGNQRTDSQTERRGSSVFLMIVNWFKGSFEYRGKASARKLTVFIAFVLLVTAFVDHLYSRQTIQSELLIIFSTIVLLGLGFLTAENLVQIFRAKFNRGNIFNSYDEDTYFYRPRVDNPEDSPEP